MGGVNPHRAYAILKLWYWHASTRVPNPSLPDMEKVRGYFHTLYKRKKKKTPGLPLATHVGPTKLNSDISLETEVKASVRHLRPLRTGGHTHLRAEQFKKW